MERAGAMALLAPQHHRILEQEGLANFPLITAEQIHGKEVALVTEATTSAIQGVDALITCTRGLTLGIYVADCAPVWIVARDGSAGALVHSGRKGTELGIVPLAIEKLLMVTDLDRQDLNVVIGPCIRPPCYEIDFAVRIQEQARECGVMEIHDGEVCTACHPELYYSYRREKGLTGRMLATLTLLP
jgi:copper oxidase (laccase) domain-containing protein